LTTTSVFKADLGSIGGHKKPSRNVVRAVDEYVSKKGENLIIDHYTATTGDDISVLMAHYKGIDNREVHKLAWDAFTCGTEVAREDGLYAAGQDLVKNAFSGNVRGLGPAVAELDFKERPAEVFALFAADKTNAGAFNLPLYSAFADARKCSGLIQNPEMKKGFRFKITDAKYTKCFGCQKYHTPEEKCEDAKEENNSNKSIWLSTPEDIYDILFLLRNTRRYFVEGIFSKSTGEQVVSVSTTKLFNVSEGKYIGKDDPVMLVRYQGNFPAAGEVEKQFEEGHLVTGWMRGSLFGPLMPCKLNSIVSYDDGPPIVTGASFSMHNGKLLEPVDVFSDPIWDYIRNDISRKAIDINHQKPFEPAMLPTEDQEYSGPKEILKSLEKRSVVELI